MEQRFVAIYARVSDAESAIDSSIPDQLREARQFAERKWPGTPIQNFSEVESAATITERKEFCRLLELSNEDRVIAVVVRDQDRLSRNTAEMLALHQHLTKAKIEVWLYRQGQQLKADAPHDRFTLGLFSLVSELERGLAAIRTKGRLQSMRNEGKWTGGHIAKGFDLVSKVGAKILVPNEAGKSVLLVFQKAAETRSLAESTRLSRSLGLWSDKQSVQYALRNRVYLGEYRKADGTWIKGHHAAIVDEDTFNRAQAIVGLDWNPRTRKVDRLFLLQGFVRCQHCNRMLVPYHVRKGNGLRIFYYECNSKDRACPTKRLPATDFENWAWAKLAELCQHPKHLQGALNEYEKACTQANSTEIGQLRVLEEKLKEARTKQASIEAFLNSVFKEGKIPATKWNDSLVELEAEIARLSHEANDLREKIKLPRKVSADRSLRALREILGDGLADPKRKQRVFQALVKEIVVGQKDIEIVLLDPAEAKTVALEGTGLSEEWFEQPSSMAPRPGFEPNKTLIQNADVIGTLPVQSTVPEGVTKKSEVQNGLGSVQQKDTLAYSACCTGVAQKACAELSEIVCAWTSLPDAVKQGMLAMVRSIRKRVARP